MLPELTKIHSLAIRDIDTGDSFSFADNRQTDKYPDITEGLDLLSEADEAVAHNGIEFDHRAILKCYPSFTTKAKHVDTMVLARFLFSNIKEQDYKLFRRNKFPAQYLAKPHSLGAWGFRLGVRKADYQGGWEQWNQEMHDYMIQDVVVLEKLYKHCLSRYPLKGTAVETELAVAEWLCEQKTHGFKFDEPKAVQLYTETLLPRRMELEEKLKQKFKGWYVQKGPVAVQKRTTRFVREHLPEGVKETFYAGTEHTKVERILFNPSSRPHLAHVLQREYGWKPQEFTDAGQVEVSDDIVGALPYPEAPLITEYLLLDKRIGQLAEGKQAWLKIVDKAGFIHGSVNQSGTATHRASHSSPNVSQVPAVHSPYGKECRSLFAVPAGFKLVGSDASGCQLRCLSHYMARYDGGAYGKILIEADIHAANLAAGAPYLTSRDMAKTFIYAFLFGAGNWKLGHTCRPLAEKDKKIQIGTALKAQFLRSLPALGSLVAAVQAAFRRNKQITLLDGHIVYLKSEHAALNYLLQGTEAIISKRWIFHLKRTLAAEGLRYGYDKEFVPCVWNHDETQIAVRDTPGLPERVAEIAVSIFPIITEELGFRCPLAGESKIGMNWADTH